MQWDPRKKSKDLSLDSGISYWSIGFHWIPLDSIGFHWIPLVMECYGEECWLAIPLYLARFWSCISDVDLIRFVVVSVSQYFSDFFHSHPFSSILQFLPSFSTDQTEQAYISLECDTSLYFGFDLPATASVNSPTNRLPRTRKLQGILIGIMIAI